MTRISLGDWCLIPGPAENPPSSSVALDHCVDYAPDIVASTFLAFPGMRLVHDANPSWWDWKACWQAGGELIEVDMSLFETDPPTWGGSLIRGYCQLDEFLAFVHHVRHRLPGVWLHNSECEIHSPESFAAKIAAS